MIRHRKYICVIAIFAALWCTAVVKGNNLLCHEIRKITPYTYSEMLKSECPKTGKRQNLNKWRFGFRHVPISAAVAFNEHGRKPNLPFVLKWPE